MSALRNEAANAALPQRQDVVQGLRPVVVQEGLGRDVVRKGLLSEGLPRNDAPEPWSDVVQRGLDREVPQNGGLPRNVVRPPLLSQDSHSEQDQSLAQGLKQFSTSKLLQKQKPKCFTGNDAFYTFDSFLRKFNVYAKIATEEERLEMLPTFLEGMAGRHCEVLLDSGNPTYDQLCEHLRLRFQPDSKNTRMAAKAALGQLKYAQAKQPLSSFLTKLEELHLKGEDPTDPSGNRRREEDLAFALRSSLPPQLKQLFRADESYMGMIDHLRVLESESKDADSLPWPEMNRVPPPGNEQGRNFAPREAYSFRPNSRSTATDLVITELGSEMLVGDRGFLELITPAPDKPGHNVLCAMVMVISVESARSDRGRSLVRPDLLPLVPGLERATRRGTRTGELQQLRIGKQPQSQRPTHSPLYNRRRK